LNIWEIVLNRYLLVSQVAKLKKGGERRDEKFLAEYAASLREQGFSVDDKCRIDEKTFAQAKGKESVDSDLKSVEEVSKDFEKRPGWRKIRAVKDSESCQSI